LPLSGVNVWLSRRSHLGKCYPPMEDALCIECAQPNAKRLRSQRLTDLHRGAAMTGKFTTLAKQLALAAAFSGLPYVAAAHDLTLDECLEGSDFILHAAMSRENGMTREAFLGRMESDIRAIQQIPPQLRWFVQDQDDEELLTHAAQLVFDLPREPESHQSEFLAACAARAGTAADTRAASSELSTEANIEADPEPNR
jgi:hypothetical protein